MVWSSVGSDDLKGPIVHVTHFEENDLMEEEKSWRERTREFTVWALVAPAVMILLFGCATLSLFSTAGSVVTDTNSALAAEYELWPYLPMRAILPGIIREIQFDLGDRAVFLDPVKAASDWIDTEKDKPPDPTEVPSQESTSTLSPSSTEEITATSTLTVHISGTPPSQTPTRTPSFTPYSITATPSPTWTDQPTSIPTIPATNTPTITPTLDVTSTPTSTLPPVEEYVSLGGYGVFASNSIFDPTGGSITLWLKFQDGANPSDHMIIHTDDSRWVFYVDTFYSATIGGDILSLAARAGGNQQSSNAEGTRTGYPEARLLVDNDGSLQAAGIGDNAPWTGLGAYAEGEWHHIAMTWQGYSTGVVKFFLDGQLKSELDYNSSYSGSQPLFEMFSFGHKPYSWPNPNNLPVYGDSGTGRLASGGIQVSGLRIYGRALNSSELSQLVSQGP
jgi:hypothetical protein